MVDYEEREGTFIHKAANIVGNLRIGRGSRIDAHVTITGDVTIGKMTHISDGVCIFGGAGVEIGDFVGISPGVKIFTATEDSNDGGMTNSCVPAAFRAKPIEALVRIGDHCLIGANSVLLPGAGLDDGAVVGALSLVKKILPGWATYAGTPAKFIRSRVRKGPVI